MTEGLTATLAEGAYRVTTPQQTLARINPLLAQMGITRAADITGLDRLGIPTWCAIRPEARQVQVTNGKGLSHAAAKVSALMEAIEHWHAEYGKGDFCEASSATLVRDGVSHVAVGDLPDYEERIHLTDTESFTGYAGNRWWIMRRYCYQRVRLISSSRGSYIFRQTDWRPATTLSKQHCMVCTRSLSAMRFHASNGEDYLYRAATRVL